MKVSDPNEKLSFDHGFSKFDTFSANNQASVPKPKAAGVTQERPEA